MDYITETVQETSRIAETLAKDLVPGMVILLKGELGSGKTTFTKALATFLGVEDVVTSPTFTLMNLYEIQKSDSPIKNLVHIDTYRMETEEELTAIGAEDYIGMPGSITVIEWPEKLSSLLKNKKCIYIEFQHLEENKRKISVQFPSTLRPEPS